MHRHFSIRRRVTVLLAALLLVGFVATDIVTYFSVQEFLSERVDGQLASARAPIEHYMDHLRPGKCASSVALENIAQPSVYILIFHVKLSSDTSGRSGPCSPHPVQVVYPSGSGQSPDPAPVLPATIRFSHRISGRVYDPRIADANLSSFEVKAGGNAGFFYRVQAVPLPDGAVLVAAAPLAPMRRTLADLVSIEVGVSLVALAILVGLAVWLVRLGLKPLEGMARQAEAIAAGDLSRRVEPSELDSEVGRLGRALNTMLSQIESAFDEREASDRRLRRFVADVSHELRTPLTSIRGYAELFRRGASSSPEELERAMSRIEGEASRMSLLVDDLMLLARLDQGRELEQEPVDLVLVASDAVSDVAILDPSREVTLIANDEVTVTGDENRLRQLVSNLVTNAVVHTPPETPIRVMVGRNDGMAKIEVWDRGPAIAPEELPLLFERFRTGARSRSDTVVPDGSTRAARDEGVVAVNGGPGTGAGLGLSIVSAIALAHGGRVWATSSPDEGTTFHVELET